MPAQPPVTEPEEEMEAQGESRLPGVNGEVEEPRGKESEGGGGGETMDESIEESDSERSEEEEEGSSGKM